MLGPGHILTATFASPTELTDTIQLAKTRHIRSQHTTGSPWNDVTAGLFRLLLQELSLAFKTYNFWLSDKKDLVI